MNGRPEEDEVVSRPEEDEVVSEGPEGGAC